MSQRASTPGEIIRACIDQGGEEAWVLFVETFQQLIVRSIARVVCRYGTTDFALIDDLTQETFLRLCREDGRALREFEERHESAIFGYIKVIATSVALDHFRARTSKKRGAEIQGRDTSLECTVGSSTIEQAVVLEEINRRLAASESERDRIIFWLYYRHGYSAREITALPGMGLTQKGIESCIYRMTGSLRNVFALAKTKAPDKPEGISAESTFGEMQ